MRVCVLIKPQAPHEYEPEITLYQFYFVVGNGAYFNGKYDFLWLNKIIIEKQRCVSTREFVHTKSVWTLDHLEWYTPVLPEFCFRTCKIFNWHMCVCPCVRTKIQNVAICYYIILNLFFRFLQNDNSIPGSHRSLQPIMPIEDSEAGRHGNQIPGCIWLEFAYDVIFLLELTCDWLKGAASAESHG